MSRLLNQAAFLAVLIALAVPASLRAASSPKAASSMQAGDEKEAARQAVADLGSPYYLAREAAFENLDRMNLAALPFLVEGLDDDNPRAVAGCLKILTGLMPDESLNTRVMKLASRSDPEVTSAAVGYLAAHPATGDDRYLAWSAGILEEGTPGRMRAYLLGVARPAPAFQTGLILDRLPFLPGDLQADAVEALARGERSEAAERLRACIAMIRGGRLEKRLLPTTLDVLEHCVTAASFEDIVAMLLSPSPLIREKAQTLLAALRSHIYRTGRHDELIAMNRELHRLFPRDGATALDLADSVCLYGADPSTAAEILHDLRRDLAGRMSTEARLHDAEARLGLATAAFFSGGDWRPFLEENPTLDEEAGEYVKGAAARHLLLKGALVAAEGGNGKPHLLRALEIAPYEPYAGRIDAYLAGRFSVAGLLWRLARNGGEDRCRKVYDQVVAALREDRSRSDYFPDMESLSGIEDRTRSSFPLNRAYFFWNDLGDPQAAVAALEAYIAVVEVSTLRSNLELAARAFFIRGAAEIDLGKYDRAGISIRKGIEISEDILSSDKSDLEKEGTRGLSDLVDADRRRQALGLLQLATLVFLEGGPPERTAELVAAAHEASPELVEVRAARALVLARRGLAGPAAKILASVEEYEDQFYNKACLFLRIGRKDKACEYLARHFDEYVRPLRMERARAYALSDPDLAPLGGDPRFIELTGAGQ